MRRIPRFKTMAGPLRANSVSADSTNCRYFLLLKAKKIPASSKEQTLDLLCAYNYLRMFYKQSAAAI